MSKPVGQRRSDRKLHAPTRRKRDGEDRLISWAEWDARYDTPPARDATGKWRREVRRLAKRLGWQEDMLWTEWEQMACLAEFEMKLPRDVAEHTGFRLLRCYYDKLEMQMEEV